MAEEKSKKPQQEKIVVKDTTFSDIEKRNLRDLNALEKAQNRWDFQDTSTPIKKSVHDSKQGGKVGETES